VFTDLQLPRLLHEKHSKSVRNKVNLNESFDGLCCFAETTDPEVKKLRAVVLYCVVLCCCRVLFVLCSLFLSCVLLCCVVSSCVVLCCYALCCVVLLSCLEYYIFALS
jgi:hypothetical protein